MYSLQCTVRLTVYNTVYSVQYSLQCAVQFTVYSTDYSVRYSLQYSCGTLAKYRTPRAGGEEWSAWLRISTGSILWTQNGSGQNHKKNQDKDNKTSKKQEKIEETKINHDKSRKITYPLWHTNYHLPLTIRVQSAVFSDVGVELCFLVPVVQSILCRVPCDQLKLLSVVLSLTVEC